MKHSICGTVRVLGNVVNNTTSNHKIILGAKEGRAAYLSNVGAVSEGLLGIGKSQKGN